MGGSEVALCLVVGVEQEHLQQILRHGVAEAVGMVAVQVDGGVNQGTDEADDVRLRMGVAGMILQEVDEGRAEADTGGVEHVLVKRETADLKALACLFHGEDAVGQKDNCRIGNKMALLQIDHNVCLTTGAEEKRTAVFQLDKAVGKIRKIV